MENKKSWLGILVMVLVFGMTVIGCDTNTTGVFKLTDIPAEYNGKYIMLSGRNFYGAENIGTLTGKPTTVQISNGTANIPMWATVNNSETFERFSGNDTLDFTVVIGNSGPDFDLMTAFYRAASRAASPLFGLGEDEGESEEEVIEGFIFRSVVFSNGSATKSFTDAMEAK